MSLVVISNLMIIVAKNQSYDNMIVTEVCSETTEDIQPIKTSLLWVGDNTGNIDINEVINPNMVYTIGMPIEVSLTEEPEALETEEPQENDDENHAPMYYYVIDDNDTFYMDKEWQDYLYLKLKEYGYEDKYKLMVALIYHESRFNPSVISSSDDYGLCQININNHNWLSSELGITNFLDPYQSIDCGVYMFTDCIKTSDNLEAALVKYNQGHSSSNSSTEYSRGVFEDETKLVEL